MTRGTFIVFEGGEGTGKSTQARLLADWLSQQGHMAVLTREPGGTPGAEAIRSMLLHPPSDGWNGPAEALLFAAARSDHVDRLIKPALQRGEWVICDRFVDSSRAYQGGAGGLGDDTIKALHVIGSEGFRPDVTILIDVPPEKIAVRLAERDQGHSDAIGGRDASYHATVAQTFLDLAKKDKEGFLLIDGDGSVEEIHKRVIYGLQTRVELSR